MKLGHLETRGVRLGESWRPAIFFVLGETLEEFPLYQGITRCSTEEEASGLAYDLLRGGLTSIFMETEREHWQKAGKNPAEFFVQQVADHLGGEV